MRQRILHWSWHVEQAVMGFVRLKRNQRNVCCFHLTCKGTIGSDCHIFSKLVCYSRLFTPYGLWNRYSLVRVHLRKDYQLRVFAVSSRCSLLHHINLDATGCGTCYGELISLTNWIPLSVLTRVACAVDDDLRLQLLSQYHTTRSRCSRSSCTSRVRSSKGFIDTVSTVWN